MDRLYYNHFATNRKAVTCQSIAPSIRFERKGPCSIVPLHSKQMPRHSHLSHTPSSSMAGLTAKGFHHKQLIAYCRIQPNWCPTYHPHRCLACPWSDSPIHDTPFVAVHDLQGRLLSTSNSNEGAVRPTLADWSGTRM